jgi:hypothetical protein
MVEAVAVLSNSTCIQMAASLVTLFLQIIGRELYSLTNVTYATNSTSTKRI